MKYTTDCPQCATEFRIAGPAAAKAGLNCPKCGIQFYPENVHHDNADECKHLRGAADVVFVLGMIGIGAGGVMMLFAPKDISPLGMPLFIVGVALILMCQLLHIRAALEKLDRK